MKDKDAIMAAFDVDEETAIKILEEATEYANQGKGLVFTDEKTVAQLAKLFDEEHIWLNAKLNERLGWQFSQAVYGLRQLGWKIKTVNLGRRVFGYKLVSRP